MFSTTCVTGSLEMHRSGARVCIPTLKKNSHVFLFLCLGKVIITTGLICLDVALLHG